MLGFHGHVRVWSQAALALLALVLAGLWAAEIVDAEAWAAVVAALTAIASLELWGRGRYGHHHSANSDSRPGLTTDPVQARRIVDEAVFARQVALWRIAQHDPDWALRELQAHLRDPVRLSRSEADEALSRIEEIARDFDLDQMSIEAVRALAEPALGAYPSESDYLDAIERIVPHELRIQSVIRGYRWASANKGDIWASTYLWVLADLSEADALLPILEQRLATIPEMRARDDTVSLAHKILGPDDFRLWCAEHAPDW